MIEIRLEEHKIRQFEQMLAGIPNAMPRVMSRGLNRTADHYRTRLSRLANDKLKIGVRNARRFIYIKRATKLLWRAKVDVTRRGPLVSELKPKQTATGVRYLNTRFIPHAFIATGAYHGRQVWLRSIYQLGYRKYITWKDRDMEALYMQKAGSLADLLGDYTGEVQSLWEECRQKLESNIHDQVQLILRRRAG